MARLRILAALAAAGSLVASAPGSGAAASGAACRAATVHGTHYPGAAPGLGRLPWVAGAPGRPGLVGLLWYWPAAWGAAGSSTARIWTGGHAPIGRASTKILWVFLGKAAGKAAAASDLVVKGTRLDGPGSTRQRFAAVSYAGQRGAPSFASIVSLPTAGCWRLNLAAGRLKASVVFRAVAG